MTQLHNHLKTCVLIYDERAATIADHGDVFVEEQKVTETLNCQK